MRPIVELVTTTSFTAVQLEPPASACERRQLDDLVLAFEDTRQPLLERLRPNRRQEPDSAQIDADHRNQRPEEPLERAEHRPIPAEHDRKIRLRRIAVVAPEPVLLELVIVEQQLDPALFSQGLQALQRVAGRFRPAVCDHGHPLHLSALRCRSSFRAHRESPAVRG